MPTQRQQKIALLNNLIWDYDVSPDELLNVIEEKKQSCPGFTRESLFARCLTVLMWQDITSLWDIDNCISLYTENVRKMLFPKSLREEYDAIFKLLRTGSLSFTRKSSQERKAMQDAFLFNRRNSTVKRFL